MFAEVDIILLDQVDFLPPNFSANEGWFGQKGSILDLLYRALVIKRVKQQEKRLTGYDDRSRNHTGTSELL